MNHGIKAAEIIEKMADEAGDALAVVIATYNEIDNLPVLVACLAKLLPESTIVVVDDNSPDGTGIWCRENRVDYPQLHVIHRIGKLGLGSATVTGMQWALENGYRFVATMDADLSHDPADLPALVKEIRRSDAGDISVVIGSRYVAGGSIVGWPLARRVASIGVNWLARNWLKLKTRDNSGAFRVYSAKALETIGLETIDSRSYAYLEEILWRLQSAGFRATEIPIVFRDRQRGETKTNWRLGVRVLSEILRMRQT